jgi:adenylate kinase family enzyme
VLQHGIESEQQRRGVRGFILDGFPRTKAQAETLLATTDVGLAVNLSLREEVLVGACCWGLCCSRVDLKVTWQLGAARPVPYSYGPAAATLCSTSQLLVP